VNRLEKCSNEEYDEIVQSNYCKLHNWYYDGCCEVEDCSYRNEKIVDMRRKIGENDEDFSKRMDELVKEILKKAKEGKKPKLLLYLDKKISNTIQKSENYEQISKRTKNK